METIDAIKAEMQAVDARKQALETALQEKQQAMKADAVEQVRQIVESMGLTRADLEGLFEAPKKTRKPSTERAVRAIYRDAVTGNEYRGGKVPAWLQGRMAETGLPYEQYREQHLQRVN